MSMRAWIDIINEKQSDESRIADVYMDLSSYVTFGEWRSPTQFNALLRRVYENVPRPTTQMLLYRVLRLSGEQKVAFQNGNLVLEPREFASWTKSLDAAKKLGQSKGDDCIILHQTFPPENIVIDIDDFYTENEWNNHEFSEYYKYVRPEQEVIVYHQEELHVTTENTMLTTHEISILPMIGDKVFFEEDDDEGSEIEDVDHDQPFAQRGIFSVTTEYYDTQWIRFIGEYNGERQWEVVHEVNESTEQNL